MSSARRAITRVCGAIHGLSTKAWAALERARSWQSTDGTQRTPRSSRSAAAAPRRCFAGRRPRKTSPGPRSWKRLSSSAALRRIMASPCRRPAFEAELDQPVQKAAEAHPGGAGCPREQAGRGHAGNSVGFEDENIAVPQHHIGAAVPPAEKRPVGLHGVVLRPGGQLRVDARRADLLARPRQVFGLVIEELMVAGGDDLDD